MADRISDVTRSALASLALQRPQDYRELRETLDDLLIDVEVDTSMSLRASGTEVLVDEGLHGAPVRISLSRAALIRLADGEETLSRALLAGHLNVIGDADDLRRAHIALTAFVGGLLHTREPGRLLERWKGSEDESERA